MCAADNRGARGFSDMEGRALPRAFDLFPEVDTGGYEVPKGWNEAVQACYNAAGYRAALNMAHALSFALGAEWIWKASENEH